MSGGNRKIVIINIRRLFLFTFVLVGIPRAFATQFFEVPLRLPVIVLRVFDGLLITWLALPTPKPVQCQKRWLTGDQNQLL